MYIIKEQFKQAYYSKHKQQCLIEKFPKKCTELTPINCKCHTCNTSYTTSVSLQLNSNTLPQCLKCNYSSTKIVTNEERDAKIKLKKKFDYLHIKKYAGKLVKRSDVQCECGHSWKQPIKAILKLKVGCTKCTDTDDYLNHVKTHTEHYCKVDGTDTILTCKKCKGNWTVSKAIFCGSFLPCPYCAIDIEHDMKIVEYLCSVGVNAKNITKYSHNKQVIEYLYQGKLREFRPSIVIGNAFVVTKKPEVMYAEWNRLVAMAKAAIKLNIKIVLLCDSDIVFRMPKDWHTLKVEHAKEYHYNKTRKEFTILAFDPGMVNFAWSVLRVTVDKNVQLLATGMLKSPVSDLTGDLQPRLDAFLHEIRRIRYHYSITHTIMERFMYRMGISGITMEVVNFMIGSLLADLQQGTQCSVITASQWKNEWNRNSNLKLFYTRVKSCTVHQIDSIGIGYYGAARWTNVKPFADVAKVEKYLIKMIPNVNLS